MKLELGHSALFTEFKITFTIQKFPSIILTSHWMKSFNIRIGRQ